MCISISSCTGNRKEIQRLALVVALGIDLRPDDKLEITMQVLNPSITSVQTQGGDASTSNTGEILIFKGVGDTFYDAVYEVSKSMSKIPHFGHTKYIVINEALAVNGISGLIDSLLRLEEFRLNTPLLVTKEKASAIASANTPSNPIPANVVEDLFLRQELIGYRPFSFLLDIVNTINSETSSTVLAVIDFVNPPGSSGTAVFELAGTAVFKKDKLIGYLNDTETRGYNWIKGKVELGNITFNTPEFGKVSVEVLRSSTSIKPVLTGDNLTIEINIKSSSNLRRVSGNFDPLKKTEIMDKIGEAQSKEIKGEVELALMNARETLGADIFGFGETIHRSSPVKWKQLSKNWNETYRNLNITLKVESTVRGTGALIKSFK
jgi:spore germination protein KC